jgi:hypothetical protein
MKIRNPQYNEFGGIDCEYEHPKFGWIEYSANADDVEPLGRKIYEAAKSLQPSQYVAPPPNEGRSALVARLRRNKLLRSSDWTQVSDAPVNQAAWATYRQALRDVPQQEGFPDNITWPEVPA